MDRQLYISSKVDYTAQALLLCILSLCKFVLRVWIFDYLAVSLDNNTSLNVLYKCKPLLLQEYTINKVL